MKTLKELLKEDIISLLCTQELSDKEIAVIAILTNNWGKEPVKQQDILEHNHWQKAMSRSLLTHNASDDTLKREIRKTVRKLRVERKLPIIHDHNGYFLPETEDDLSNFIVRLESEAKSRAASSIETYKVMKDIIGISSSNFDEFDFVGNQLIRQTI